MFTQLLIKSKDSDKVDTMIVAGVLIKDIYFEDEMGEPVVILKDALLIIDLTNDIAWAQGLHFTIDRREYRILV